MKCAVYNPSYDSSEHFVECRKIQIVYRAFFVFHSAKILDLIKYFTILFIPDRCQRT